MTARNPFPIPSPFLLGLLLGAFLLPAPLAAAPPVREGDIPVLAGAERDPAGETSEEVRALYRWKDAGDESEWIRVYRAGAPPEKVFEFYRKALSAEEGDGGVLDLRALAPGTVTPPVFGVSRGDGTLLRAGFSWVAVGARGEITGFRVGVEGLPGGTGTRTVLWKELLVREQR